MAESDPATTEVPVVVMLSRTHSTPTLMEYLVAPFDILWHDGELEDLVQLLADPRPPQCPGRIRYVVEWSTRREGVLHVGQLAQWRQWVR